MLGGEHDQLPAGANTVLRLADVTLTREDSKPLLSRAFATLAPGEALSVLGASGTGKTALARAIALAFLGRSSRRQLGSIQFGISSPSPGWLGVIFDDPQWAFCNLRVDDEVAFALENAGVNASSIHRQVSQMLDYVGLTGFDARSINTLSGGEMRRLALAAALIAKPGLMITDDLEASLDVEFLSSIRGKLDGLVENEGLSWLNFSRYPIVPQNEFNRVAVLGCDALNHLDLQGRPDQFLDSLKSSVELPLDIQLTRYLLPKLTSLEQISLSRDSPRGLVRLLAKHGFCLHTEMPSRAMVDPPLLAGIDISFSFDGHRRLLERCALELFGGQIHALSGPNGAGKSTLARIVSGLLLPRSGSFFINGKKTTAQAQRKESFLVFQNPEYQFIGNSVQSELSLRCDSTDHRVTADVVDGLLLDLQLESKRSHHPHELSMGERRRLAVALAQLSSARILIVDEPTLGQDILQSKHLGKMLRAAATRGVAVLVITHDHDFINEFADRLLVLEDGVLTERTRHEGAGGETSAPPGAMSCLGEFWARAVAQGVASGLTPRTIEDIRSVSR